MPRRLALWLTLPTGFAGLVYEVAWEQALATLLGSHSEAAAAVLALFLGGLAGFCLDLLGHGCRLSQHGLHLTPGIVHLRKPLFLILLGRHAAWTGNLNVFHELREPVENALAWMAQYGDLHGDGYLA